jgi:hypothetical protein
VYGGKDDVENAISYLQKAFANKAHVIPGEKFPILAWTILLPA